jgi:hypothetical protein
VCMLGAALCVRNTEDQISLYLASLELVLSSNCHALTLHEEVHGWVSAVFTWFSAVILFLVPLAKLKEEIVRACVKFS